MGYIWYNWSINSPYVAKEDKMKPNYVAKKSIVHALNFWLILFFWLVIPLIIQIVKIVKAANYRIEFYDEKVVVTSGVISTSERQSVFAGVYSVAVEQSLLGRIFSYGDIRIDCPGKWDIDTEGIKNPKELKKYLEQYITNKGIQRNLY